MKNFFQRILDHKQDAVGLSVFRMLYAVILFCELTHAFLFRNIIFDRIPFAVRSEIDFGLLYTFYSIVLLLLFSGLFTRVATILNYVLGVVIFSSALNFEYHVFYTYVGVNFCMMFMPVSRVLSLDSLLDKIKYTQIGSSYKSDRKVLEINYLIPVYVGVALVYFDSIFLKLDSAMWRDGLGVWLPSSLPMVTWHDTSFFLNQEALVIFLGYFVLVFEAVFIFLLWFKKLRPALAFIGVLFHLGILVSYPIPWFALTYMIIYLLLLPPTFWLAIGAKFQCKIPVYTFYYDAECPLCLKVVVAIKHLDVFKRVQCQTVQGHALHDVALQGISEENLLINIHGVTQKGRVFVGFQAYVQLFKAMGHSYLVGLTLSLPVFSHIGKSIYSKIAGSRLTVRCTAENCSLPHYAEPVSETEDVLVKGWNQLAITKAFWKYTLLALLVLQLLVIVTSAVPANTPGTLNKVVGASRGVLKKYWGLARHGVFLDRHFQGFNHIFKVTYIHQGRELTLPLLDDSGMPSDYVSGSIWRNISFDIITPRPYASAIENGMRPYMDYYLRDKGFDLSNGQFVFYVKTIDIPTQWEPDFLHRQMAKPWVIAGQVTLRNGSYHYQWTPVMKQILANEAR